MRNIEDVILSDGRKLKYVLESHKKWLWEEEGGERADLSGADLNGEDLRYANLRYADLSNVNLSGADLRYAILSGADLRYANLINADLSYVNLINVNLINANLSGANLSGANLINANLINADLRYAILINAILSGANLNGVKYNEKTSFFALTCPVEGAFIGYKKANNKLVKLLITEDAKRSSATTRKCRCSKAKVLSITSLDGKEQFKEVTSNHDENFIYEVGKMVEVEDFDEDRWNECSTGIHFFITRDEAVNY